MRDSGAAIVICPSTEANLGDGLFPLAPFLAAGGRNPLTGHSVVRPARARRINALMLMCGHYDGSGEFAYRVGLPGKSGVGGGILVPVAAIATGAFEVDAADVLDRHGEHRRAG